MALKSAFGLAGLVIAILLPLAATAGDDELVIAANGKTGAVVVVSAKAGEWEKRAAADLVHYVQLLSGARPALADDAPKIAEALKGSSPLLIVGAEALRLEPAVKAHLEKAAKRSPVLRADAIAMLRKGQRIYLAGANDDSHYYAVAELLQRWGCRWYLPTEFGECIPSVSTLKVGKLDYAYAPPFEVRNYWVSWNGSNDGQTEFTRRNFMNYGVGVPSGHAIGEYVKELIPKGKSVFNVPIAEEATARHIAKKIAPLFAAGKDISLGMEDGIYQSDSPRDKELQANLQDKYFVVPSLTDNFLTLYNGVADILTKQHPASRAKLGFLAYSNITLPPQRDITAARPLVAYLAPIDIDPNHGMDDSRSPPRQEYREIMYRWAKVMQGRVVIYDYDQGMLVWRDIPNPSIEAIRQDIKHYRKAGILGVSTECRNAIATVFLNLFVRGQLYWNPDRDVDELLAEFYPNFYGPAAKPMSAYWGALFKAWKDTPVTEHEHFAAPAIYTRSLIKELRAHLEAAETVMKAPVDKKERTRNDKLYMERMQFTRASFDVLEAYMAMVRGAATDVDYKAAVAAGERGLAARLKLAKMNPTFTTRVIGVAAEDAKSGPAWWPGEVGQYRDLLQFTSGPKGTLIAKTPLLWAFRRDPHDTGLPGGWAYNPVDLSSWHKIATPGTFASYQHYPDIWQELATDLYVQAQGVVSRDFHSYTGHMWYRTDLDLDAGQVKGNVHIRFPGLFNEAWLYVNGYLVSHRPMPALWWLSDYKFEWDVDLSGKLRAGKNTVALRLHNPHHFGGMFRRPFLYRKAG